jgi:hypothetical protein
MGSIGEGPPLAGLLGVTDPGMSVALNSLLQPLLSTFAGAGPNGKYVPAQFSSGMNMYSQMKAGSALSNQSKAMGMASQRDQRAIYEMIEGSANLLGQPMGRRERQNANDVASYAASAMPFFAQINPDLVDKMAGVKGSATVMAQNMARGGRYAIDPVTGRRGYSAESAGEITKGVYDRLYSGDASAMGGMTAGRAGALFDEAQRRGMMPNSSGRGKGMKEIADQMGTTISEVSQMPDLDRKLRELDANKIASKLKGMSKAVNAMSEIFGEAGEPNAPMSQLVGAIETLTQANMQNIEPQKLARMVRNTSNVAKAAGIEMPEMFKLMGATAGMADRSGVNRAFVPGITNQAVAENQAGKNIFGGAQVFGLPNADKLLNIDQQLNVQATRDYRTQDVASIARAVETFGVEPEKGSELAAVYAAIKDKDSGGNYTYNGEKKNVYDLNKQEGGINQFLAGSKVPISVIQSLNANRDANEALINKYDINTNIGRQGQTRLVTDELSMYNSTAVRSVMNDEALMKDVSPELRTLLNSSAQEITDRTSEGLFADNLGKDDLNDLKGLTQRNLNKIIEEKGIKVTEADKKALAVMAGSIYESSDAYARNQKFEGGLPTMAYSMNKGKIREAQALKQEADITSQFEEGFGGMGKSSFLQRTTDFLRGAGKETKVEDFMAAALNFQPKDQIKEMFAKDFDDLQKSAEAFKGANGEQVKTDYLRSAITINADEISKETDPEKKKKLIAEQNNLKEDLIRSGFTDRAGSTDYYNKMIDNKEGGVTKAKEEQQGFESKYGVTVEQAKNLSPLELQVKQKEFKLNQYKEQAERLNIRMNNSGLMVGDVSGDRAANEAIKYLEKGDISGTSYGVDLAKKYISDFGMDKAAVSKAGVEGNAAKEKAQGSILRIEAYAKALGVDAGELLNGDFDAGGLPPQIDIASLIKETDRRSEGLDTLYANKDNGNAFADITSGFKKQADALRTTKDDPNEPQAQKAARAREINRLDDLSNTTKENLSSKMTAAKKAKEELQGEPLKALKTSFEEFKKAQTAQEDHEGAVASFIKEVGTREGMSGRTLEQIAAPDPGELGLVRELRDQKSKITGTSKKDEEARKEIDKKISATIAESGIDESKFKGLDDKDYDEATAILKKYDGKITGEETKRLEHLAKLVKPQDTLTAEDRAKLEVSETGDVSSKGDTETRRLSELKTKKARTEHGGEAIEFTGIRETENAEEAGDIFRKYNSAYALTANHSPFSEEGKAKEVERQRLLELGGIKTKDRARQDKQIEMMYDKQKAVEAGITYGQSFVIDKEKGIARAATDEEVASGNFSYINKSGDKITQGRESYYGTSAPAAGTYDKFKNGSSTPLTAEEEKELLELSNKQGEELNKLQAKKEKYENTLKEPERKEYESLLAKRDKIYSPEDRKKLEEYAIKSDMKFDDLKGLEDWKQDNEKAMKGLTEEDKLTAKNLMKEGKAVSAQQIVAATKLGDFSPQAVMALMGAGDPKDKKSYFNALLTQEKKGLMSSLKDLGVATTLGGATKMTASQEAAIGKASELQAGTTQTAIDFFTKDLKLSGMGKGGKLQGEVQVHEKAAREVGKDLTLGMEVAGRLKNPKNTKTLSKDEQLKALSELLSSTDDKGLSEEQKTLKKGMLDKGFKDVIGKDGKVQEDKLIELFKKTETTIAEKNALAPDGGKEGNKQVTAVFEKGQKFEITGTLGLESNVLAGMVGPSNTSSA